MGLLLWLALVVAVLVGMCVGAAINREYGRAFQRQAERSRSVAHQLRAELEAAQRRAFVAEAQRLTTTPAPPLVVNLHLPPPQPSWPSAPALDAHVVPAITEQ